MDNVLFKTDKPLTQKEILTYYLNVFSDKLIANIIDLQHYEAIKVENPKYRTVNAQGMTVSVDQLITGNKNGARYARRNVAFLNELLKKEAAGTLDEVWSDEVLKVFVSPITQEDKKGDETEGKK